MTNRKLTGISLIFVSFWLLLSYVLADYFFPEIESEFRPGIRPRPRLRVQQGYTVTTELFNENLFNVLLFTGLLILLVGIGIILIRTPDRKV